MAQLDSSRSRDELTIACCQVKGQSADDEGDPREANLKMTREWTNRAAKEGADLVVFGETFLTGYDNGVHTFKYACDPASHWIEKVGKIAAENDVNLVMGATIRSGPPDGGLHNSALLFDRDGELQGRYDKTHLGDLIYPDGISHESAYWDEGDEYPIFDIEGVTLGIHICYDVIYPETARILAVNGAEVIVNPAAAVKGYREGWNRMLPCRALENQVYYAMCAPVGTQREANLIGGSRILDPSGDTLTEVVWEEETLVSATIDLNHLQQTRSVTHNFGRRRPEIYTALTGEGTEDS